MALAGGRHRRACVCVRATVWDGGGHATPGPASLSGVLAVCRWRGSFLPRAHRGVGAGKGSAGVLVCGGTQSNLCLDPLTCNDEGGGGGLVRKRVNRSKGHMWRPPYH